MSKPDYTTRRTKHRAKQVVRRDRLELMVQEPECGQPGGPGSTTIIESMVTCEQCLAKRGVA